MLETFTYLLGLFIILVAIGCLFAVTAKDIYKLFRQRYEDDEEVVSIILKEGAGK